MSYHYPRSDNENERLDELLSYQFLDSPVEQDFEELVQLATNAFHVPVAAITFVDATRQWIKAAKRLDISETDGGAAVCNYTILKDHYFEVEHLQQNERFRHFPSIVNAPFYRYFAGVPLVTAKRHRCVLPGRYAGT